MQENLIDLESLALRCKNYHPKNLILESILCYQNGAFRSAIITTWIAVVFDLLEKIQELSHSNNSKAKELISEYTDLLESLEKNDPNSIKRAGEFESNILMRSRDDLQFFDLHQFSDLIRLKEDRHRCAHPTLQKINDEPYKPSAEQVRMHIRNALLYVLVVPPIQGKEALSELKSAIASKYFPQNVDEAKDYLLALSFEYVSDALINRFVEMSLYGYLNENDQLNSKENVIFALSAAKGIKYLQIQKGLIKWINKILLKVEDKSLPLAINLAVHLINITTDLDENSKIKIINFIQSGSEDEILKYLESLSKEVIFKSEITRRISNFSLETLSNGIINYDLRFVVKERVIQLLSEVRSWTQANQVISKTVLHLMNEWDKEDIVTIIKLHSEGEADLLGAYEYELFIKECIKINKISENEIRSLMSEDAANHLIN